MKRDVNSKLTGSDFMAELDKKDKGDKVGNKVDKKEILKSLLRQIHEGKDVNELKEQFKDVLKNISPLEIPLIEQELVKEGISTREIAKMCDIHVELFRESVKGAFDVEELPQGHPLHTLFLENDEIIKDAEILNLLASTLIANEEKRPILGNMSDLVKELAKIGHTHYNREEMLIFPYLERRGITAIPNVLWFKHDEIRVSIRKLSNYLSQDRGESWEEYLNKIVEEVKSLSAALIDMVFRENNIFYPTLKALLSEGEWKAIKEQENLIGYYKVEPPEWESEAKPLQPYEIDTAISPEQLLSLPEEVQTVLKGQILKGDEYVVKKESDLEIDTGFLSRDEINAIFKTFPFDITFIDKEDRVRFFSGGHRIFARTPSVIGRPVQLCHPPRSVHIVNKILEAFKSGEKDVAEFWIQMGERMIHIRYFAVRDGCGEYLGTLEVVQDITDIKRLEGEKRLLGWKS